MNKVSTIHGTFEYNLDGNGEPTFVMISGYGESIETWNKVCCELKQYGKVFSYNRHGIGGSDHASTEQCGKTVVSGLREILNELSIMPPYILVGHSIGGLYAALYGRLYPNEICGAVLIEPMHPEHEVRLKNYSPPLHVRFINGCIDLYGKLFVRNKYDELKVFKQTVQQYSTADCFPNVPLSVIAGAKKLPFEPDGLNELHISNQKEFTLISKKGKFVVAKNSGHFPHLNQPELVLEVAMQTINEVRQNYG